MNRRSVLWVVSLLVVTVLLGSVAGLHAARANTSAGTKTDVSIVYYYTEGCSECHAVEQLLDSLKATYSFTIVRKYDALDVPGSKVRASLDDQYGVPEQQRGTAPTIFVGKTALVREKAIRAGLEHAFATTDAEGNAWLASALVTADKGGSSAEDAFRTFSVLTVIGAGLLDGVNPCAFATLIFFISYLIMRSKKKRDILLVGVAFGAGVFLAYFLAGLGLYKYVAQATWFFAIARWFYLAIGVFALVIAGLSFRDAYRVRHGKLEDMSLQLSQRQKKAIHGLIRKTANTGFLATTAFLVAFPVSLFEFLCTGQTYLPTIVLIYSQSALRARATLLLVVYNLLFILPLLIITFVAWLGTSSDRMTGWLTRNAVVVKIATAVLFLLIAGFLLVRAFTLMGVIG
jgi:cytochrome c biogenesis protein CcdA/glutaredoxin